MITMDKKYKTRDGQPARILCVDAPSEGVVRALIGAVVLNYTAEGVSLYKTPADPYDLIEVGPYDDFVVDEPVMVRDNDHEGWQRRLFVGVRRPQGWAEASQQPAWVRQSNSSVAWAQCRRPTAEELKA